jgi:hypothetical protein
VIPHDFSGNSAEDGGAIYNTQAGYPMDLTDVSISGNHASAYGAGIYDQGTVDAVNTKITRNSAATGGGIYDDSGSVDDPAVTTLTNSSVLSNEPDNCEPANSIAGCRRWLILGWLSRRWRAPRAACGSGRWSPR